MYCGQKDISKARGQLSLAVVYKIHTVSRLLLSSFSNCPWLLRWLSTVSRLDREALFLIFLPEYSVLLFHPCEWYRQNFLTSILTKQRSHFPSVPLPRLLINELMHAHILWYISIQPLGGGGVWGSHLWDKIFMVLPLPTCHLDPAKRISFADKRLR